MLFRSVALAKAKPGALNCASPGNGTPNHLGCEMLKTLANINFVHVPYKGTTPAITDVVGGQMHFMLNSIPAVLPLARSGKVRMLGDGSAEFTKATGLTLDLTARGMGLRSNRYSMLIKNGKVATLNIEAPGKFEVSDAATMLAQAKG